jgi:hypothetical protein
MSRACVCRHGGLNKAQFAQIVYDALGYSDSDELSREKVDVLYRVLDTNRDGFLDAHELERVQYDIMHYGCVLHPLHSARWHAMLVLPARVALHLPACCSFEAQRGEPHVICSSVWRA